MLYFHIPFCKQKCSYCNFHFSTSLNLKDDMMRAIHKEIDSRHHELSDKHIKTLYLGGGTPSLLSVDEIKALLDKSAQYYDFDSEIEITLEANPDDLNASFLKELSKSGVNRLSIGTQSFFEDDLKLMNRAHTAGEAEDSIKRAQDFGLENISIDLIYGSSSMPIWKENLQKAIALQIPHISSYALTVEPKTALAKWIKDKVVKAPNEEVQNEEFYYMSEFLKEQGFIHYEISNFAKEGFYSKHNSAYWKGQPYLGFGPSAHSYNGGNIRSWNIANNALYIKGLAENTRNFEEELLSPKDQLNELVMIGLRTVWGVDMVKIQSIFEKDIQEEFFYLLNSKKEEGLIVEDSGYLKIPEKYWFLADGIASGLFLV
ncbi:radical SAM family heme chaperone HemW [Elizabethkingia miricola]|uniref:radical SAM family heme chaperone HemW n=1 Tax=Elizabethkingia miricola TaxID=172045 RepID=UPI000B363EFD|nr:radical SAM family heme chaperone HemW [Elizabethkingia miricola]NHQ66030.1 radical SAM family heme chaperone HemW [Elizabethkingia miricola]NHQ69977.1 radical SAM family heme chaperone HemW [Elizabethkingia miricola]NHQ76742.1 radical SAM family heme chaperone HemW [Elizabethkingia miricola]PSL86774.1 coproporphyrinogen III oxidase family protein [Elizabethkingia miricola]QHQ86470.1 radical SAM family heme chaperone HemW [Elizabethkingia miricola]